MTVTVTKPQATLRELLAGLKKKTGLFGEQVMRTESATDFYNLIGTNRNLVINGDFRVSQRGDYTSPTTTTSGNYYLDRWYQNGTGCTLTHNLNQTLPDGTVTNTMKYTYNGTTQLSFGQQIEPNSFKHLLGKLITVSAWVKTNMPNVGLRVYTGTQMIGTRHPGDGTWRKLTYTLTLPNNANNCYPLIDSYNGTWTDAVSGSYVEIAQVQLEEGSVATPFEVRPYGQELALCQRYYYEDHIYMQAYQLSGQDYSIIIRHPVTMYKTPNITVGSALISVNLTSTTLSGVPGAPDWTRAFRAYIRANATGLVEYNAKYFANAEI